MARIDGVRRHEIAKRADLFAAQVTETIRKTLQATANRLHGTVTVDDLGTITGTWRQHVARLTPEVQAAYLDGARVTRVNQRDALVGVLKERSAILAAGGEGDFEIPLVRSATAEELMAGAENRLVNVGNEVWEHARGELLEGLQAGEGIAQLQARVVDSTQLAQPRAEVIARSEINRAMNQGSLAQMNQVQLQMTKEWISVDDGRTRPEHAEMDGVKIALNDTFSIGFDPGDDYNCRCTLGFDIPDDQYAEGVCGCGDGEVAVAASALVAAASEDLGSVCACSTDEFDKLDTDTFAPKDIFALIRDQAQAKIAGAPTPSIEAIAKAQDELAKARAGLGRAGGESRGGSAAARRKQRLNLYNEFGGEERGYVPCHSCGLKVHWADPGSPDNPHGYARFERGKIFVKCQGGGYQLLNLLPECFGCNRSRNDKMIRNENRC